MGKIPQGGALEFSYQGTTSVFAHDGKSGWQIAPLQGQFEPRAMPPEADSAGGADQRDSEGPLVDWKPRSRRPCYRPSNAARISPTS